MSHPELFVRAVYRDYLQHIERVFQVVYRLHFVQRRHVAGDGQGDAYGKIFVIYESCGPVTPEVRELNKLPASKKSNDRFNTSRRKRNIVDKSSM